MTKDRLFSAIGGLLGFGLVLWVVYSLATYPMFVEIAEPGGFQPRGVSDMPDKAMEKAISDATGAMKSNYQSSHAYRWWSRCADWVGFLLTAAITVIVGSTGKILQAPAAPAAGLPVGVLPADAAGLGRKWVQRIGVMAALASVLIAVGSRVAGMSHERLELAENLRGQITKSRIEYAGAATPTEAQSVVDELVAETEKQR